MIDSLSKQNLIVKIKSYIGFAKKSGNIKIGADNILATSKNRVIIISEAVSDNTKNKLNNHSIKTKAIITTVIPEVANVLFDSENIKAIGILDLNLANAIMDGLKKLEEA